MGPIMCVVLCLLPQANKNNGPKKYHHHPQQYQYFGWLLLLLLSNKKNDMVHFSFLMRYAMIKYRTNERKKKEIFCFSHSFQNFHPEWPLIIDRCYNEFELKIEKKFNNNNNKNVTNFWSHFPGWLDWNFFSHFFCLFGWPITNDNGRLFNHHHNDDDDESLE